MTRKFVTLFIFLLITKPEIAAAHTSIKGISNFFNGMLHPVLTPSHLLLLIATSLFLGAKGFESRSALLSSIAAVVLGLALSGFSPGPQVELFILVWVAVTGLIIAAAPALKYYWYSLVGIVAGFSLGFDSALETLSGIEKIIALFGSGVSIYFISLFLITFAASCNKKNWSRIGMRVIGSWLAASSLLVLVLEVSSVKL